MRRSVGLLCSYLFQQITMRLHRRRLTIVGLCGLMYLFPAFAQGQEVDPLTGRLIVDIPLGQFSVQDLSVSVGLTHNGGGLRVAEGSGNAGMSWNVQGPFGQIFREVKGLPDELNSGGQVGWLSSGTAQTIQNFSPVADDNVGVCTDEFADWNFINSLGYIVDTEPDIFYAVAPGGVSCKFVFGADGTVKLTPFQDLQITYSGGVFTIKTNTGTVYTFSNTESVERQAIQYKPSVPVSFFKSEYNYYTQPLTFIYAWHLTSIQSGASGATINYTYQDGIVDYSSRHFTLVQPADSTKADTLFYYKEKISPKELTQVTLQNYSMTFSWMNSLIQNVTISESESGESKQFELRYHAINSSLDPDFVQRMASVFAHRYFLTEVKQINNCNPYPAYKFSYELVDTLTNKAPIPWHTGWGQDFFGYFNGQASNKNIPRIYFYAAETGARRYRVTPLPGVVPTQVYRGIGYGCRNVNSLYTGIGAIRTLEYPTGAITSVTYEANKYLDTSTGEELLGPGIRVKSITTSGGEIPFGRTALHTNAFHSLSKSYEYTASGSATTSGKITYPPAFTFTDGVTVYRSLSDIGPGTEVLYGRVKENIPGQGYRVYLFDLPNMFADATPAATPSKVARPTDATCSAGILRNGPYTFPFAPLTDLDFKRGLLTRMSEFSETGALTQDRRLTYTTPQAGSTIKGLRFEATTNAEGKTIFHYSVYQIPVNQSKVVSQEFVKVIGDESQADSTKTITTYVYNTKNRIIQATQANDDNSAVNQYFKYADDYVITTPTPGDLQANAIYKLNTAGRTGEVIETYQTFTPVGGTAKITGGTLNLFKDYGTYVWPYQGKHFPQGPSYTVSSATTGTTQSFDYDSDYILDGTSDYVNALPVNFTGTSLMTTATHYATGAGLPLATFINCKAEHAVYDGFEFFNSRGLATSTTSTTARTGKKSAVISNIEALASATSTTRNGTSYRVGMWVYSTASNVNIVVSAKNGSTVQGSLTLNYPAAGVWTYLEGFMDMTSVSASFTWAVTTTSPTQILVDDFVALPRQARVSYKTWLPLTGVTSESDDRGNSVVTQYDAMGRKVNTLDRKRNLVSLTEYGLQKQNKLTLKAAFTASATAYVKGNAVTLTAAPTCIPQVAYNWTFTDAQGNQTTATGSPLTKTFSTIGAHSVKLTVSSPNYGSATFTDEACVTLPMLNGTMTVSPSNVYHQCSVNESEKTFNASLNGYPISGLTVSYVWSITDANGNYTGNLPAGAEILNNGATLHLLYSPLYTYTVKCDIKLAGSAGNGDFNCKIQQVVSSPTATVTFYPESQCQ
ncbi:MAG: PKD domain-containing protein [Bacteroidota bacterium]